MSAFDLLNRHTTFPYYARYKLKNYVAALEAFTKPTGRKPPHALHHAFSLPPYLRYCNSCVRRDIESLGETYWRRSQQLTGVLLCPEHEEVLVNSSVPTSSSMAEYHLYDATMASKSDAVDCAVLTEREHDIALDISRRCQDTLISAPSEWSHPSLHPIDLYRQAAFKLGYGRGMHSLNSERFSHDFYEFYQLGFLSKFGFKVSPKWNQVQAFMNRNVAHPLLHVLVQRFLDERLKTNIELQSLRKPIRPIRCPNPYAGHPDEFRIENIVREVSPKRGDYFIAHCICGHSFSFQNTDDRDPAMPVVLKRSQFGETFMREARRLYQEKASVNYVSKKLGVANNVANRLIKGEKSKHERVPLDIPRLRKEWKKSRLSATYQTLLRFDREWVLAQKKPRKPRTKSPVSISYSDDAVIASEIREGAKALLLATPPRRVTTHALCLQIGRPYLKLRGRPLSKAAMSEVTEALAKWHKRKVTMGSRSERAGAYVENALRLSGFGIRCEKPYSSDPPIKWRG
jgi:Tn7-like transposition protein D